MEWLVAMALLGADQPGPHLDQVRIPAPTVHAQVAPVGRQRDAGIVDLRIDRSARRESRWLTGGIIGGLVGGIGTVLLIDAGERQSEAQGTSGVVGFVGGAFAGFAIGSLIGHAVSN